MCSRRVLFSAQKNEGPFILEWVAFHKIVGFTDIIVASNNCTDGSDLLLDALHAAGEVHHIRHDVPAGAIPQLNAQRIAREQGLFHDGDWVLWLDLDEFLVPGGEDRLLETLIAAAGDADAVALNWVLMGDNGQTGLPSRLVSPQFDRASRWMFVPNELVKTLFRYSDAIEALHLHRPIWRAGTEPKVINGAGNALSAEFVHKRHRNGDPAARSARQPGRYRLGQINHYSVRTRELFALKKLRGRGFSAAGADNSRHDDDFYDRYNRNDREDRAILLHEAATTAEIARLMQHADVAEAHQACTALVADRLAAAAP